MREIKDKLLIIILETVFFNMPADLYNTKINMAAETDHRYAANSIDSILSSSQIDTNINKIPKK